VNKLSSILVVLILVCCSALFACSGNAGNTNTVSPATNNPANAVPASNNPPAPAEQAAYPQEVADEFLKSCQGAGSDAKLCSCLFDRIQDKYSFEEFTVMELKLSNGEPPEEFVQFVGSAKAQCRRER
jgi:hypothetical protein